MPKIKDPDALNAETVNDNKSRHNDRSFVIRNIDNATDVGAVPFRPRIRNAKANALMSENNGLQSLTSDITKFAHA